MSDPRAPSTIAVLHMNQVGDLVFSLPALAALRAGFPGARLFSVLRSNLEPLLAPTGLVDDVVEHRGSRDFFRTADRLRAHRVELAVCLSESPRTRLLAYLSGAQTRMGLGGGPLASLLTSRVEKRGLPSTANNLRLVAELGCPIPHSTYQGLLQSEDQDRMAAENLIRQVGASSKVARRVVIAPGASRGREAKEWPLDGFSEVAAHVAAQPGNQALVVGAEPLPASASESERPWIDLSGRTSLRVLIGILDGADLFVGNDSGVLHLAACLGVPCIALFGPTDPEETGPHGEGHVVLRADPHEEMTSIPVESVTAAVDRVLAAERHNR